MQDIKAFVGHSFGESDRDVITKFLDHFRTLAKVYPGFSWDHAEEPELKTLSEKVLAKIEDKNVFIGICTRREKAVEEASLAKPMFQKSMLMASEGAFKWKTSDWIIQEIGLAIGRKMKLILFLEEGVRDPGGLYGDLEYIPFDRARPHDSFDKLLQMLSSLSPIDVTAPVAEAKPATADEESEPETSEDNWEPDLTWTKDEYETASFRMIRTKDKAGLARVDDAFKVSIFAQGEAAAEWDARIEYFRMIFGAESDFEKLKHLAAANPKNSMILYYLATGYNEYRDHENAAKSFEEAAAHSSDDGRALRYRSYAAIQYAKAGSLDRAQILLEEIKADGAANVILTDVVVSALRSISQTSKNDDLELAVMEESVELYPSDMSARFALAYKHSECENGDLALHHYSLIPPPSRDSTTWNNLGVSYGEIGMAVRSVRAFRTAAESNETLAMSNLGFKLLSAGFIEEAQEQCGIALKIPNYHKSIPLLLNRLQEVPDEEEKKLEKAIEKVKAKAAFYKKLGESSVLPMPKSIATQWQSDECVLVASIDGANIRLVGSYERKSTGLGVLSGALGLGTLPQVTRHKIEFVGRLWGQIVIGSVTKSRDGQQPTLLEIGGNNVKVLMYFAQNAGELHIMENPHSVSPNFSVLKSLS